MIEIPTCCRSDIVVDTYKFTTLYIIIDRDKYVCTRHTYIIV